MKAFNRILGVVVMFSVVVIFVVGVQHGTAKPNMEECNPQEMGRLESAMWRSYYDRQWPQLVGLTFEGACGQFGFSWWDVYIDYFGHTKDNGTMVTAQNGFTTLLKDRGSVYLTFKTTF